LILTTRKAYLRYLQEASFGSEGTKRNYHPKINKLSKLYSDYEIKDALTVENIESFILSDGNLNICLSAIEHFYNFIYSSILSDDDYYPFPINKSTLRSKINENIKNDNYQLFLERDFDFEQLFNDNFYDHLKNNNIKIALKAFIATCLGAAFETGEIEQIKVDDFKIEKNIVKVKNPYQNYSSKWIMLNEQLSKYVIDFYNIRIQINANTELFFVRTWSASDTRIIDYDDSIWLGRKPSILKEWASYILKYISDKLDIVPHLSIKHLKDNAILQYLYLTNGKCIDELIRTFGWKQFVIKACNQFFAEESTEDLTLNIDFNRNRILYEAGSNDFFLFPHRK
jgi:site-specific recombinase XerD